MTSRQVEFKRNNGVLRTPLAMEFVAANIDRDRAVHNQMQANGSSKRSEISISLS